MILAAAMPLFVFGAKKKSSSSSNKNAQIQKQIEEDQGAISDAQDEKKKLNENVSDVEKVINSLETQKGNLENYVKELDSSLNRIQDEINSLNDKIEELDKNLEENDKLLDKKEEQVEDSKEKLEEATETLDTQYADMKQHIKYMYETRNATFIDVIANSSGIKDFLNRAQYVMSMAEYDQDKLEAYAEAQKKVEEQKKAYEDELDELNEMREKIQEMRDEISGEKDKVKAKEGDINKLISAKEQEINIYNADILSKEQMIAEYKKQIAEQDAIISALEASVAANRAKLSASGNEAGGNSPRIYDGGPFAFPCPSYTRISDDYGNRIHPILQTQQFHNGVDFAAPSGSPILAAADGTVIAAAYSSSMGNYVMIDHGSELYTIYMHASSLLVSTGATVSKGQKIALVGSTGRSTGPHLHFSVRKNGSYVSPWNYLK